MSHTFSPFRLLLVTTLFHFCFCNRKFDGQLCIDDERQALLEFKHGIIDQADRLASWVGDKSDCCTWDGIACDNSTGHVHQIRLPGLDGHCYNYQHYRLYDACIEASKLYQLRGDLNPSLLQLKQLRHLDLSCNDFGGMQVPSFISSLGNLRYLDLSNSGFGGVIPSQLGNISKLHVLSLGNYINDIDNPYELTSVPNMQWLSSLHLLTHLDMRGVNLSKTSNWFQVINTLPSFKLHLSRCELSHIEPYVHAHNLTSLTLLDLSCNNFSSSVPWWIFSITNPVYLDLSDCHFRGPIPSDTGMFQNLTALKFLYVWGNDFMNSSLVLKGLSSSVGSNLISLDISFSDISSPVLDALHNLTSLRSLYALGNQLTKAIPKSLGDLCSLRDLELSFMETLQNTVTNILQSFIECKSSALEILSVVRTGLSGYIPYQLGKLIHLQYLLLDYNHIVGIIPDSIGHLTSMRVFSLSNNLINGHVHSHKDR